MSPARTRAKPLKDREELRFIETVATGTVHMCIVPEPGHVPDEPGEAIPWEDTAAINEAIVGGLKERMLCGLITRPQLPGPDGEYTHDVTDCFDDEQLCRKCYRSLAEEDQHLAFEHKRPAHLSVTYTPDEDTWTALVGMCRYELHVGGELAGWATVTGGETLEITAMVVDPDHRTDFLGSRLLQAILAEQGHRTIGLSAVPFTPEQWAGQFGSEPNLDHGELAKWYRRHGFKNTPTPDDAHRMTRPAT